MVFASTDGSALSILGQIVSKSGVPGLVFSAARSTFPQPLLVKTPLIHRSQADAAPKPVRLPDGLLLMLDVDS
jgi:hypothetical protein